MEAQLPKVFERTLNVICYQGTKALYMINLLNEQMSEPDCGV